MKGSPAARRISLAIVLAVGAVMALAGAVPARTLYSKRAAARCGYSRGYGIRRNPSNPLALRTPPGADPLNGADLFVEGPGHGLAAQAIVRLLGRNPARYRNETWAAFARSLDSGRLSRRLKANAGLAHQVNLLRKIAAEPETARFSVYSAGGGPGAIYSQVRKFVCRMQKTDRHAVPMVATYFLTHTGNCHTNVDGAGAQAIFRRRVHELAAGLGRIPVVLFAEIDAVDTAGCLSPAGLAVRIKELKFELDTLAALPHGVVYVEGGVSDATTPRFAARILGAIDIGRIRGFFVNDTHFQWTSTEVAYGNRVSRLTHGSHFVVNTADNGRGPKLDPHASGQGTEDLCNPPGRGMGPQPTTATGFPLADAWEWTGTPGRSSGNCGVGHASSGTFDVGLALGYASRADNKLGPGYPSSPY